jgi:hypothetical protein
MTTTINHPLWQRLQDWHPDKPGAVLPFSRRLAIENAWSPRFALRAVEEYKRFVFLACTAGHPVTPSEAVDQTWHLHLVYTRSYWDDLCANILERPLHHSPTEGGGQENEKYWQQYNQTLDTYHQAFGHAPPDDIWPPAKIRFQAGLWQWVNKREFWVIKKWGGF